VLLGSALSWFAVRHYMRPREEGEGAKKAE
jgi:hypothetical protein